MNFFFLLFNFSIGENLPVENVSWYDAIYFCNALSKMHGLNEVYSVNGKKDVSEWNYVPLKRNKISGKILKDDSADVRLIFHTRLFRHKNFLMSVLES